MKKLLGPFCLTLIIFIGSVGVSDSADFKKGLNALRRKTTQLLCVNGNLLPKRDMPLPRAV